MTKNMDDVSVLCTPALRPSVGTCGLGAFSSKDLCWSASYINSSCSNTLGKEYDPKNNHKEKCVMKGHGSGAEDIGQKSSKNREQEIKEPAAVRNLFWLWFTEGGGSTPQPARASCSTCHSHPTCGTPGGGRMVSMFFSPGSWLPLNHPDEKCT